MEIYAKLQCICSKCRQPVRSYMNVCPICHHDSIQKFFQTYNGHILDALKILHKYIEINQDVIDQFCERWQINKETFLECAFITVYLHDIGKLTFEFQENIKKGKTSLKQPHAYYALSILNNLSLPTILDTSLISAVILAHHRQLYNNIYENCLSVKPPSFLQMEIANIINEAKKVYHDLSFDRLFHFNGLTTICSSNKKLTHVEHRVLRNNIMDNIGAFEPKDKAKLKSVYCFLLSILKTCDYYSSAEFSDFIGGYTSVETKFDSIIKEPEKYVLRLSTELSYEKILNGNEPYSYQCDETGKLCGDVPFFGLLLAPCGRGKTETSLIWALKAAKKYQRNKIVFAMPTQITSNAIWERFCAISGKGETKNEQIETGKSQVGLFHGKSLIILKDSQKGEEENEEDLDYESVEEVKNENFKGNVFFKPISVTTIDHLVYSFIHGFSQADFALGNLQNSVIVFDEVHYYEKQTMEHLLTLLELLKGMKIPTLLMSGTLPNFFIEKVKKINPAFQWLYSDDEGLLFEPFKILLNEEPLVQQGIANEQIVKEIVENYRHGLVQFVILNTIERSKAFRAALIAQLPEARDTIVLHNSQFTYRNRADKEKDLLHKLQVKKIKPFILVATQVIEISLDISCDIMYTELAPADALGQRGGRLNRKGKKWRKDNLDYVMKVFTTEELLSDGQAGKTKPYDRTFLVDTKNAIDHESPYSYNKLKQLCDKVYAKYELNTPTNLRKVFRECALFGFSPYEINFDDEENGRVFQLRNDDAKKMDVIPANCYNGDKTKLDVENQVPIPLYRFREYEKQKIIKKECKNDKKWYWVANIDYSKESGFDFYTPSYQGCQNDDTADD